MNKNFTGAQNDINMTLPLLSTQIVKNAEAGTHENLAYASTRHGYHIICNFETGLYSSMLACTY